MLEIVIPLLIYVANTKTIMLRKLQTNTTISKLTYTYILKKLREIFHQDFEQL